MSAMEWNCSQYRMKDPSDAMNRAHEQQGLDWHAKLMHCSGFEDYLNPCIQDLIVPADIIIVQRNIIHQPMIDAIQYWQGLGKPIAVDLDDWYQGLVPSNTAHAFWIQDKAERHPLDWLERGLRITNALTAPNRQLLSDWSYACQGYYLPNYGRDEWWLNLPSRDETRALSNIAPGRIVIGWGGSVSHYDSWWGSGIREAAERVCRSHSEVVWVICGNDPRIHYHLPLPLGQKMQQPGVPPQDWPKIVKLFDIGVAPLFGPYDQRRSYIKGMEYMLAGVPWVGARGEPYRDLAPFGTLVGPTVEEWEEALEIKIQNLKAEQELAAARVPAAQRLLLLGNNLDTYGSVYREIIADFKETSGALAGIHRLSATPATPASMPVPAEVAQ